MSVLVYTEASNDKIKKSSLEAIHYGSKVAAAMGTTATAVIAGGADTTDLGKAGANKILKITGDNLEGGDPIYVAAAIEQAANAEGADLVIFAHDFSGKAIGPRYAAKVKAGMVAGAVELPEANGDTLSVRKGVFSGKASAVYNINTPKKVISVLPGSLAVELTDNAAETAELAIDLSGVSSPIVSKEVKKASGGISMLDADIVVSGGRGLKGPENWGMVEELATELGAATACSRPVADSDWRPHHEHVGQTGFAIRPNLYIAIGISGAIQHLAGVNGSKTIVVINTDAEAPFFKSADYGIVGDAFDVVPKLIAAVKSHTAN